MARKKAVDPGKIRVRVLGTTEIMVGHRRIGMNTEVLFALALYLTTRAGERIPREELLPLFWNEGDEEDRRHALRQQMYRLRQKGLEVDDGGELIRLDPQRVDSDVRAALAEDWWETATEDQITQACDWGPVFARHRVPAFHEWIDGIRTTLGQNIRRAALRQVGIARREGRWADLDRWGRVMISTDPLNEEGTLARAESAAVGGSKTVALEIIDNYLSEIGDIDPDLNKPALQLRKRIAERRPDWAMRGPKEVPLVGRTELMTKLTGLVEDVWKGEGRAVVLTGAAGIGKTRLAMEARAYAELKGMRTVKCRTDPASSKRPLATIQQLATKLLELPGAAGCHPDSLTLIKRMIEHGEKLSRHDAAAALTSISEDLADAFIDLCEAVADSSRTVVIIDDLHHLDAHSFAALDTVICSTAHRRIGWIFTAREMARLNSTPTALPSTVIRHRVLPLNVDHAERLAHSTSAAHGVRLSPDALSKLVQTSGGNPLFVRELAIATRNRPAASGLPETLTLLIEERLGGLTQEQRSSLAAAAFLGDLATLDLLERATGRSSHALAADFEALENDGIVLVNESRSLVLHECWRQAALDALTGTTRAALAKSCADAVARIGAPRRSTQHFWHAAQLYREAGYFGEAVLNYFRSAESLYSSGLPAESVRVLRIAQELIEPGSESIDFQRLLVSGLLDSGEHLEVIAESTRILATLRSAPSSNRMLVAQIVCARVDALVRAGRPLEDEIRTLAELASDRAIPLRQRQACALAGIVWASNACDIPYRDTFNRAADCLNEGEHLSLAGLMTKVIHACETHDNAAIHRAIKSLRAADTTEESMYLRCRAMRIEGRALRELRADAEARDAYERSFVLAESIHLRSDAAIAAELIAFIELDRQRVDEARIWISKFEQLTPNKTSYERASSLDHLHDRVLMQTGDLRAAAARLRARASTMREDWNLRRQASELGNLAFALASDGDIEEAISAIGDIEAVLAKQKYNLAADYATEMVCRTLRLLGRNGDADCRAAEHAASIPSGGAVEFPPFFVELRAGRALHLAAQNATSGAATT